MKVVHINHSYSKGGAAHAMLRLNSALINEGVDSSICSLVGGDNRLRKVVPQREAANVHLTGEIQSRFINQNRTDLSDTIFTLPGPGCDLRSLEAIKQADVINLHWVNYFLSPVDIKNLHVLGKPIVWTIHDEWAYTGGCHYRGGCSEFTKSCSQCPQLHSSGWTIPKAVLSHKKKVWNDIPFSIVGPSNWITDQARASGIFKSSSFYTIRNSIDTDTFCPKDKSEIRCEMGIPENAFVVLFGADVVAEKRKGFDIFNSAVDELTNRNVTPGEGIHLLCFGDLASDYKFTAPFTNLGYLDSPQEIAKAYQASDLFVLPSLEDNLPNTMLESMACGTPILGFDTGGIGDIVTAGENGYLAVEKNSKSLAALIAYAIRHRSENTLLGIEARKKIVEQCSHEVQATNYTALYESLVAPRKNQKTSNFTPPDDIVWISGIERRLFDNPDFSDMRNEVEDIRKREIDEKSLKECSVCDFSQITFLGGVKEVEGPYSEYNLPQFVWCYSPQADISIRSLEFKEATLVLRMQSPFLGVLVVENNTQVFGEYDFLPNFANCDSSFYEIRVTIPVKEGENYIRFRFRGEFEDSTEAAIFSKIEII